ncbi:MAG: ribonuclease P protein component [Acidobacteria bacterium]|nr:MAG: ribonuclease P protein component [Acidobacteriota bacterium]
MTGGRRPRETFPPAARLRKRREFLAVYERGVRVPGPLLVLFVVPRREGGARLGITTTRRLGSAVVRNRLRRLVREVFRRHRHRMPSWDLVVNVRAEAREAGYREIETEWQRLVKRAERKLAREGRQA